MDRTDSSSFLIECGECGSFDVVEDVEVVRLATFDCSPPFPFCFSLRLFVHGLRSAGCIRVDQQRRVLPEKESANSTHSLSSSSLILLL